jgi:glycosyltransferase involved in cell wall biosynthesis
MASRRHFFAETFSTMNADQRKTVALINPLWIGHHPMYFSQFTASFLRNGVNVIGLCPNPLAAINNLREAIGEAAMLEFKDRVVFHELPSGPRSFFNGRFEGDPLRTFQRWQKAAEALAIAEADYGLRADLIYFPYLDSFLRFLPFASIPKLLLDRAWSGLYLRYHHHGEKPSLLKFLRLLAKGDALLKSSLCRGIGVLDERFIPALENLTCQKVTHFPDVTDTILPATTSPAAAAISGKAMGRTIIGMIGLERRKGFLTLLRTAELARQQSLPYYFVAAGIISSKDYSSEEIENFQILSAKIAAGEINNLAFDLTTGRIPDEASYNSVFSIFDIAWAAYENFQGSSGSLSKAAAFNIPCLASRGECIGQRVENYQLGLTISQGNAEQALAAIPNLIARKNHTGEIFTSNFAAYREHHSLQRLDQILAELLTSA